MFSLGVGLTVKDFTRIVKMPLIVFVGLLGQLICIPVIAFLIILIFKPTPEIAIGVMILSFCPGGVVSNVMTKFAYGNVALSISLTGIVSLLSIISLPILVMLSAQYFLGKDALSLDIANLGLSVFLITALPVTLGMAIRHFAPRFTLRCERLIVRFANLLFLIIVGFSIAANWSIFIENVSSLAPMLIGLNVILLGVGLGLASLVGLHLCDQVTIGIETGMQNSALGITIGSLISGAGSGFPVFSLPSGVYAITAYFVIFPFILWARSRLSRG